MKPTAILEDPAAVPDAPASRTPRDVWMAVFLALLAAVFVVCTVLIWPGNYPRRMADLQALSTALEAYKADHGEYPKIPEAHLGFNDTGPDDWLPGLVPDYLPKLPRDPRQFKDGPNQYLYLSNGTDYKLVAHNAEDTGYAATIHPEMMDPRRPTYAYGYWTPGGAQW